MPLLITVEDSQGNEEARVNDDESLLIKLLNFSHENKSSINVFKYIDPYDDTTFNGLQVKDFLIDIDYFINNLNLDSKTLELLKKLQDFSHLILNEPHLYLKFHGD